MKTARDRYLEIAKKFQGADGVAQSDVAPTVDEVLYILGNVRVVSDGTGMAYVGSMVENEIFGTRIAGPASSKNQVQWTVIKKLAGWAG